MQQDVSHVQHDVSHVQHDVSHMQQDVSKMSSRLHSGLDGSVLLNHFYIINRLLISRIVLIIGQELDPSG
jgi:hypothetical protein